MISILTRLSKQVSTLLAITFGESLHKEYPIRKARESVDFAIAVRKIHRWWQFTHYSGCQPDCQSKAVEEHVDTIGKQTERPREKSIEKLNEHES
jgi:hypothetical protein